MRLKEEIAMTPAETAVPHTRTIRLFTDLQASIVMLCKTNAVSMGGCSLFMHCRDAGTNTADRVIYVCFL
jgi:hypothetical protein